MDVLMIIDMQEASLLALTGVNRPKGPEVEVFPLKRLLAED